MPTETDIVNVALAHLGVDRISSLRASNKQARLASTIYAMTRDEVLRAADWKFGRREVELAIIADEEVLEWDYVYGYPAFSVAVRRVYDESTVLISRPDNFDVMVVGAVGAASKKAIVTNVADAYCRFTELVTETNRFDSLFVKALARKLASDMAMDLTQKRQVMENQTNLYFREISEAMRINASEGINKKEQPSDILDARD